MFVHVYGRIPIKSNMYGEWAVTVLEFVDVFMCECFSQSSYLIDVLLRTATGDVDCGRVVR